MTIEPESIETIFDDDVTACAHDVEECGQGFIKSQGNCFRIPQQSRDDRDRECLHKDHFRP